MGAQHVRKGMAFAGSVRMTYQRGSASARGTAVASRLTHDVSNTMQVILCGLDELRCHASGMELDPLLEELQQAAMTAVALARRIAQIASEQASRRYGVDPRQLELP